jgi:tRNA (guanine37-N1)-methyltransferase
MEVEILSLFPDYFQGPFDVSILKRAQEKGLLTIRQVDIRRFAEGKHSKVDDRPFGGGPGMVLMPGPVCKAIRSVRRPESRVIYLTPQGKKLTAEKCSELAKEKHLILLCGHYEGIDERVMKEVDEEISIGDYIVMSGCVAAVVLVEAVARFVDGVLGNVESAQHESFQQKGFEAPHYTRPVEFEGEEVPLVLRQGNHKEIAKWGDERAMEKLKRVRPEL